MRELGYSEARRNNNVYYKEEKRIQGIGERVKLVSVSSLVIPEIQNFKTNIKNI